MVLFKINGERNSGTNFLAKILRKNKFPIYVQNKNIKTQMVYNWKHGAPSDDYKKLNEKVIDLFIFRNLEDWLVSFSFNNYHIKPSKNFKDFLLLKKIPKKSNSLDYRTNMLLNIDDKDKTIFEIREFKFNQIMDYSKRNKDVIFINLSYIQNSENLTKFLNFLSDEYIPKLKFDQYITEIQHTKNFKNIKNRVYDINVDDYRDIIDSKSNPEIEEFINNLTFLKNS